VSEKSSDERAPDLDPSEEKKAEEEQSLTADITYEVIRREGEKELERSPSGLAWSGLAAGLAMAFSFITEGVLRAHLPEAEWRMLVTKLGYPVGFLIVTMGSQQLFTENTLMPIVPLLLRRSRDLLRKTARLWIVVLLTNLAGALVMGVVLARTDVLSVEVRDALTAIARDSISIAFGTVVLRAILAGWLIAVMIWMLPAAESAHVTIIVIMTYVVGAAQLSHVIAGAVGVFYLAAGGFISFADAFTRFIVPALIGNVLGGVTVVAALNHAQVAAGKHG